jgi:hypothetical protein
MYRGMPKDIKKYHVYRYHHIDNGKFLDIKELIEEIEEEPLDQTFNIDKLTAEMKELFLKAGWEGDGKIELIWVPPFLGGGFGGTSGFYLWHVKQLSNGTSWIASPIELPLTDEQLELFN